MTLGSEDNIHATYIYGKLAYSSSKVTETVG
jgi:hypothetical protein